MPLSLLQRSRQTLEHFAPGFARLLAELPFDQREAHGSPVVDWFKRTGPVGLLVPKAAGGLGATALEAVQVQVAIGALSPSLAIASTMHQFSVASLVAVAAKGAGAEGLLLSAIAQQRLLVASGFAEGVPGGGILDAGMEAVRLADGVRLNGSKQPCSLASSMDLLTASFSRDTEQGEELMIALIPAAAPGMSRHPFWANSALAGAQSLELRLEDVYVSDKMIFSAGLKAQLGEVQTIGFVWFELLICATYLGACLGMAETVVGERRWNDLQRVELASQLQLCLSAVEGLAHEVEHLDDGADDLLARLLLTRYGIEQQLARASDLAQQMLGGLAFIRSNDTSNWLNSTRGLQFHPPGRFSMSANLDHYLHTATFSIAKGANA
ncbi:acyl-CoA/acyl-ACP dehydrogenase [Pseudomonas entomophila]|uniref:acyl-CoA dehydrogenase family protein n=1 Tax=Pseudomonas entomophila TaxID=312306 RepID=UPI001BCEF31A|nr:acyl-CoA dehydrogenase family protein [Pseudomonas entomophila]QVM92720.1 acyl-CoA/acyl-ACP dehydrogenase [Pseudomonas entomophila]